MKRIKIWIYVLVVVMMVLSLQTTSYAYTDEEKAQAKGWLAANGYSPDMNGAAQAYADYMAGKFGKIEGLPDPEGYSDPSADRESSEEKKKREQSEREKAESEGKKNNKNQKENNKKDNNKNNENGNNDSQTGENPGGVAGQDTAPNAGSQTSDSQVTDGSKTDNLSVGGSTGAKKPTGTTTTDSTEDKKTSSGESDMIKDALESDEAQKIMTDYENDHNGASAKEDTSSESMAEDTMLAQGDEQPVELSERDIANLLLLQSVLAEADTLEESGKEYGITEKDRKIAVILMSVVAALLVGGGIGIFVASKKKKN